MNYLIIVYLFLVLTEISICSKTKGKINVRSHVSNEHQQNPRESAPAYPPPSRMWMINKELSDVASSFLAPSSYSSKVGPSTVIGKAPTKGSITGINRATVFEVDQDLGEENKPQGMDPNQQSTIDTSATMPMSYFNENDNMLNQEANINPSKNEGNVNLDKEILPVENNSYEPRINQKDSESEYRSVTPLSILKQQNNQAPALRNLTDILKVFGKPEDSKPITESGSNDLKMILKAYSKDQGTFTGRHKELDAPKKFIASDLALKPKHHAPAIKVEYPRPKFLEFRKPSETKEVEAPIHGLNNDQQHTVENDEDKVPSTRENMQEEQPSEVDLHYDDVDEPSSESKVKNQESQESLASARELFQKKPKNKPLDDHMKAIAAVVNQNNKISELVKQNGIGNIEGLEPNKFPNHIMQTNDRMMKLSETLFPNDKKGSSSKENVFHPSSPGQEINGNQETTIDGNVEKFIKYANAEQMKKDLTNSRVPLTIQSEAPTAVSANQFLDKDPFSDDTTKAKIENDKSVLFNNYAKFKKQSPQKVKDASQQEKVLIKQQKQQQQQQQQNGFQQKPSQNILQKQHENQLLQQPQQKQQSSKLAFLKKIPTGKPKGPSIAEFDITFQTSRSKVKTKTKASATGNAVALSTSEVTTDINGQKDSSHSEKIDGIRKKVQALRHNPPRKQGSRNSYGSGHGQGYGYGHTSYGRGSGHAWAGDNYNNYQIPNYGLPDNDGSNQNKQQPQPPSGPGKTQASQQQAGSTIVDAPSQNSAASAPVSSPQASDGAASMTSQAPGQEAPATPQYVNKKLKPVVQKLPVKQIKIKETYKPKPDGKLKVQDYDEEDGVDEDELILNKDGPISGKKVEQKVENKLERPKGKKFSEQATGSGYGTGYGNKESWGQGGGYAWAGKAPPKGAPNPADFMQKPAGMPDFPQVAGQTKGTGGYQSAGGVQSTGATKQAASQPQQQPKAPQGEQPAASQNQSPAAAQQQQAAAAPASPAFLPASSLRGNNQLPNNIITNKQQQHQSSNLMLGSKAPTSTFLQASQFNILPNTNINEKINPATNSLLGRRVAADYQSTKEPDSKNNRWKGSKTNRQQTITENDYDR